MRPFEDFQKHAMREAMDRVYSWKQEHPDEYSRFSLDMMKVERNNFSSLERIFKMAVGFVPTHVLIECRKLLAPDSEEILSADELATLSKRIMLSAIQALPEIFVKLHDQIHDDSNSLLMCTLYYLCYDHGLPRSAMALSKVSLGAKQVSYIRESVKAIVEKLMETSVDNALDKKAEWTTQAKDIEDVELKQAIKTTLASTKGKHGRRTILQEEMSLDEILISDDKQALKETIRTALNEMEHEYETAYIKAALIRSHHLAPHASFSVFLRAISDFTGREYKYDPAQRVDSFIYHNEKEFQTSKSSKWQRGRRIVSYLTDIFDTIQ